MYNNLFIFVFCCSLFGIDYQTEIQPIFDNNCGGCHLTNSQGGLNLSNYENLMSSGTVVVGDHSQSELYDRITRNVTEAGKMPPGADTFLSQSEIDLIANWIDEGALFEESLEISGCIDSNAISCDDEIDPIYFPECTTCENALVNPNDVSGDIFCDWWINESDVYSCDTDCPWDVDDAIFYISGFCTSCMADNTCGNMPFIILDVFSQDIPDCLLDCDFASPTPCENYYNENATVDNGMCMYNDVPTEEEFVITELDTGFNLDWSLFVPPVDILQYTLQRCFDPDGDTDGDGEYEYENCTMLIAPMSFNLDTNYDDMDALFDIEEYYAKYTLYVHYSNNTYWGSAFGYYYLEPVVPECIAGDVSGDGLINVSDIISTVNHIIGTSILEGEAFCAGDLNEDGVINVSDIVSLVNIILS